jgi:hypothetical protein
LVLLVSALIILVGAVSAAGPTVTPGDNTAGWTQGGALRWKGQAGPDFYLGIHDLGVGPNRVAADPGNPVPAGTYPFTFEYDAVNNDLKGTIPSKGIALTWDLDASPAPLCAPGGWDMMQINVRDGNSGGGLALKNVTLDAVTLGTGTFGTADVTGTPGAQYFTVTDYDFSAGFVLAADLEVLGTFSGGEGLKVEFVVGCAPPPPSVTPTGPTELCAPGTVDIQIDDVADLYGYEFVVPYDETLVTATGSFVNTWFDPTPSGFPGPAGWDADCTTVPGICKFAYTRGLPDGELATAVPKTIASILFTPTLSGPAGSFDVEVKNVKLTDKDSFEIPGAVGGKLTVNVCGVTTVSGQISLQGRPQPGRPQISGLAPSAFEVKMVGPYGMFSATPSAIDGTYTVTGVPYLLSGTAYTISADHSVYIKAEKPLAVSGPLAGQSTTLLGGDATDDDDIAIGDLGCVGGQFGATIGYPYTCSGGNTTPDLNDDTVVNIQDLSLVGGNYGIVPVPQPWP